jgi:hypothetical protein
MGRKKKKKSRNASSGRDIWPAKAAVTGGLLPLLL